MCEAYFRHLCKAGGVNSEITASSAGIAAADGAAASAYSQAVMHELDIDLSNFRSSMLTSEKLRMADLIIAMTSGHLRQIGVLSPEALTKTRLLLEFGKKNDCANIEVQDPFGGTIDTYCACFKEMRSALENLFKEINSNKILNKD
jgi:protein-tyrosine phosphatase